MSFVCIVLRRACVLYAGLGRILPRPVHSRTFSGELISFDVYVMRYTHPAPALTYNCVGVSTVVRASISALISPSLPPVSYTHLTLPTICSV